MTEFVTEATTKDFIARLRRVPTEPADVWLLCVHVARYLSEHEESWRRRVAQAESAYREIYKRWVVAQVGRNLDQDREIARLRAENERLHQDSDRLHRALGHAQLALERIRLKRGAA
jgi:hypothetical protein